MFGLHDITMDDAAKKLEETLQVVKQINCEFKNPVSSTIGLKNDYLLLGFNDIRMCMHSRISIHVRNRKACYFP